MTKNKVKKLQYYSQWIQKQCYEIGEGGSHFTSAPGVFYFNDLFVIARKCIKSFTFKYVIVMTFFIFKFYFFC